jgi:ABC-type transport system involved in multi-copper enzyme maturation permease subunit
MSALIRAELLKLTTTRTFAGLVGAALVLSLGFTALSASQTGADDATADSVLDLSALFILVLGILGMAGEWRHRTIAASLLAAPDRVRFVAAKLIALAAAGIVLSLVVNLGAMALAAVIVSAHGGDTSSIGDLAGQLWRSLAIAAYYAVLGVAIGAVVRNQPAAIVGVLLWLFILEPLLVVFANDVGRFGPLGAVPGAFAASTNDTISSSDPADELGQGAALVAMLVWVALSSAVAAQTVRMRDIV